MQPAAVQHAGGSVLAMYTTDAAISTSQLIREVSIGGADGHGSRC